MNQKVAVVLINLGTPEAPTPSAVRKFLREFLSDSRVVEIPKLVWQIILNLFVLPFRPKKVAEAYRGVWDEKTGSPIRAITEQQTQALARVLEKNFGAQVVVTHAMTYGAPAINTLLAELQQQAIHRILLLPLYPQYSATTTAAIYDQVADYQKSVRHVPDIRMVHHYCDQEKYIAALSNSVKTFWAREGKPEKLVFSFHGIPKRNVDLGDPYFDHCQQTAKDVVVQLGLSDEDWICCFQSRFGKAKWLQPYTDKTLEALAEQGTKSVHIICPAFAADCLETLEEIAVENCELFLNAEGQTKGNRVFGYIPALNDSEEHIQVLEHLILSHTSGWLTASSGV